MKTEWLEWLILFKKYGSLQRVSDICHVTPQNIGRMFINLENETAIELFDRSNKNLKLSQAGKEMAEVSEEVINKLNEVIHKHQIKQERISGDLELISSNSLIFPELIDLFLKEAPEINIVYSEMGYEEALESIKHNKKALAFVPLWKVDNFAKILAEYEPYLNITTLFKDEQAVFVSDKSSLAKKREVTLKDLEKKQIIIFSLSGNVNDVLRIFKALGEESMVNKLDKLNIVGTNSVKYFSYMIKNGFAVGFGVESNFIFNKEDGICIRHLNDTNLFPCYWSLVYNVKKK